MTDTPPEPATMQDQPAPLLLHKYGGSSLSTLDRVRAVARRLVDEHRRGHRVVAVVSAMGDTTSQLVRRAQAVCTDPEPRELDVLLSSGERMSMALLSLAVQDLGEQAISLTGPQAGVLTDDRHTNALIQEVRPERVQAELDRGRLVIIAGFQGLSGQGDVTTLGRGGSDTSAVALAAALGADACVIHSDVPGILTADPRDVPDARPVRAVETSWMAEYARTGARVLHAPSVELALDRRLRLRAQSTFEEGRHTDVGPGLGVELEGRVGDGVPVLGVSSLEHCLRLRCQRGRGAAVRRRLDGWTHLGSSPVPSDGTLQVLCLGGNDEEVAASLEGLASADLPGVDSLEQGLSSVSLIVDTEAEDGLGPRIDRVLDAAGVDVLGRCARPLSVTRAVRPEQRRLAVRVLHDAFLDGRMPTSPRVSAHAALQSA